MYVLLETEIDNFEFELNKIGERYTSIIGVYGHEVQAEKEKTKLIDECLRRIEFLDKIITEEDGCWKCETHPTTYLIEIEDQDVIVDEELYLLKENKVDLNTYYSTEVFYRIKLISHKKVEYIRSVNGDVINTTLIEEKAPKYKSIRYLAEVYLPLVKKIDKHQRKVSVDQIIRRDLRKYRRNVNPLFAIEMMRDMK